MGNNSEPAPSKKKVKLNGSNFKFIQKFWTSEGFALSAVFVSDFIVAHGLDNNINGCKTKTPQIIDIWMLHNDKEN